MIDRFILWLLKIMPHHGDIPQATNREERRLRESIQRRQKSLKRTGENSNQPEKDL